MRKTLAKERSIILEERLKEAKRKEVKKKKIRETNFSKWL